MGKIGIALQLYTIRTAAKENLKDALKRSRDIGWEYVQWSGMPSLPAEEIRAALDEAGLKAVACHCDVVAFETDFEKEVKFWQTVGALNVGPGGMMGDCKDNLHGWLTGAHRLDQVGTKLREKGMRLSYHNHASEFESFPEDPRAKLDVLYQATCPDHLFAEFDLAWIAVGGADPAAYVRKYAGRCPLIHAKDVKDGYQSGDPVFVPLGQGTLNWDAVLTACNESGVEWLIYEQDNAGDGNLFESVKISYDFLASNVK